MKFPLVPGVFVKALIGVLTLVIIVFAIVIWIRGSVDPVDVGGALISAVIFAYLVHLYMIPDQE